MSYILNLNSEEQFKVFLIMRKLRDVATNYQGASIDKFKPVGSATWEYFSKYETISYFLRQMSIEETLDEVEDITKEYAREIVQLYNSHRKKDYDILRAETTLDGFISSIKNQFIFTYYEGSFEGLRGKKA